MIPSYDPQGKKVDPRRSKGKQMRHNALLLMAAMTVAAPAARADVQGDRGLTTGGAHHVVVSSFPTMGLEVGMPRRGWYARAVALDLKGKWRESYAAYRKATKEFRGMQRTRGRWRTAIRGWIAKAQFQRGLSSQLRYPIYARWRHRNHYMRYRKASALHHKWLAARAFTGRSDRKLLKQVIEEYKYILMRSPNDHRPRLMLAGLYHELGQAGRARHEFSRVRHTGRTSLRLEVAYYHTAAGDRERAFKYLANARRYYSLRTTALRSNMFDRLRGDPRFAKLIGKP